MDELDLTETGIVLWAVQKLTGQAFDNVNKAIGIVTIPAVIKAQEIIEAYLERNGRTLADLNPKYRELFPILQASQYETDPTLSEMWANLLASSIILDGEVIYNHTEICKQLTPTLARVLLLQEEFEQQLPTESKSVPNQDAVRAEDAFKSKRCRDITEEDLAAALGFLTSLGLLLDDWPDLVEIFDAGFVDKESQPQANKLPKTFNAHRTSNVGKSFLRRAKGEGI